MPATDTSPPFSSPANSGFDLLATAALDGGWTEDQITVCRGTGILHAGEGDFYWLHIEDDTINVVVPISPQLAEDALEPNVVARSLVEMAQSTFASARRETKAGADA